MNVKLLEVRDRMTFIPVIAVSMAEPAVPVGLDSLDPGAVEASTARRYLLRRCGYADDERHPTIMMTRLDGSGTPSWSDVYGWADRTFTVAHDYITKHWHDLKDGDVVDVEFVLGESAAPKVSERLQGVPS